jgi:glutamyl-Q tRNA(Asp) synthetase
VGSLVAAVGSWLFARAAGGQWLVRIEDLDRPRIVPGSAEEICEALRRYGLHPDEAPVWQGKRTELYECALRSLREKGLVYDCACSRAELQRTASAPAAGDPADSDVRVYPGTCRNGLPEGREARAARFRIPPGTVVFEDLIAGRIEEDVQQSTGDFVVKRADGPFAYQLAVVVDDAEQGVTQVVRGGDLLSSTARQIALQRALGLPTPQYAHLPLVLGSDGSKLGKRDGALPLPTLDAARVQETLRLVLSILGIGGVRPAPPERMLATALEWFDSAAIPRGAVVAK